MLAGDAFLTPLRWGLASRFFFPLLPATARWGMSMGEILGQLVGGSSGASFIAGGGWISSIGISFRDSGAKQVAMCVKRGDLFGSIM